MNFATLNSRALVYTRVFLEFATVVYDFELRKTSTESKHFWVILSHAIYILHPVLVDLMENEIRFLSGF